MTNGVTPRRWVHCANPALSAIFTKYLGSHECPGGLLEIHGDPWRIRGFLWVFSWENDGNR
jgi:glucan phosphorylase